VTSNIFKINHDPETNVTSFESPNKVLVAAGKNKQKKNLTKVFDHI